MNETCSWCQETSEKIDSLEYENEQQANQITALKNHIKDLEVLVGELVELTLEC